MVRVVRGCAVVLDDGRLDEGLFVVITPLAGSLVFGR
jgi:hypothetical protein